MVLRSEGDNPVMKSKEMSDQERRGTESSAQETRWWVSGDFVSEAHRTGRHIFPNLSLHGRLPKMLLDDETIKEKGPSGLSGFEPFGSPDVLQVFMVCPNQERVSNPSSQWRHSSRQERVSRKGRCREVACYPPETTGREQAPCPHPRRLPP